MLDLLGQFRRCKTRLNAATKSFARILEKPGRQRHRVFFCTICDPKSPECCAIFIGRYPQHGSWKGSRYADDRVGVCKSTSCLFRCLRAIDCRGCNPGADQLSGRIALLYLWVNIFLGDSTPNAVPQRLNVLWRHPAVWVPRCSPVVEISQRLAPRQIWS